MFFQNQKNLRNLGKNSDPIAGVITSRNEKQIFRIMLEKITSLYGYDPIISSFLPFLKRHRKDVFLYPTDPMVEKTSDIAEQHCSIQSWLFKHRFKTKEGLLRTFFWYNHYLSTGNRQRLLYANLFVQSILTQVVMLPGLLFDSLFSEIHLSSCFPPDKAFITIETK